MRSFVIEKRKRMSFLRWDEKFDQYSYSFKVENDLSYHDPSEFRPDQQPGFW